MQNPKQWHIARMGVRSIRPGRLEKRKRDGRLAGKRDGRLAGSEMASDEPLSGVRFAIFK
jgi:hypothetical protein